jgi:hypothetical protein
MKLYAKPSVALASGAILLTSLLLGREAQAQGVLLLNESGTSILADAYGTATGPEALTVSWSVVESVSLVYTYSYVVNNPLGDVLLNNNGSPTTSPEIVDAFGVGFNTTSPGAYIMNSQTGGTSDQNNGMGGLFWSFTAVQPGTSSPILSFQSDLPPTQGYADAQDANPPSPWSSFPNGQTVPIPAVPEPATMALLTLTTGILLLLSRPAILVLKESLHGK